MAVIETVLVIPILLAMLRGGKKRRKRRSVTSGPASDLGVSGEAPGAASAAGWPEVVPGEIPGTIHAGGTGDPEERYLPESHRLTLDSSCSKMAVRLRPWDYDKWITMRYWDLRNAGWTDPLEIAVDILSMDSPHCEWPPREDSSDIAKYIWAWLSPGIEFYYRAEIGGNLKDYKWEPMPGVIPVVMWANPERDFSGGEIKSADY